MVITSQPTDDMPKVAPEKKQHKSQKNDDIISIHLNSTLTLPNKQTSANDVMSLPSCACLSVCLFFTGIMNFDKKKLWRGWMS